MANPNRAGFKFVKTLSGSPASGMMREIGIADGDDMYIGDAFTITAGLATDLAVEGTVAGVVVGVGKKNDMTGNAGGAHNPDTLMTRWYDDSANTHTEWVLYYIPAEGNVFEVQGDGATELVIGEPQDITVVAGSATTGISGQEIDVDALSNDGDITVVEKPVKADNDYTLTNAKYWVVFNNTQFGQI